MGRAKRGEDYELDVEPVNIEDVIEEVSPKKGAEVIDENSLVSCLTNERVIVRHINKPGMVTNPKHVLYGGMAENATRTYVVPRLSSGVFVNVLTKQEKDFLEYALGLEPNAMSVHKKVDNFWDDSNPNGINRVRLNKQDNYLNLNDPADYVKYKILLANKNAIAPSVQELQDRPKATYEFVIVKESDETKLAKQGMTYTMSCYKEYGKIEDDKDKLRVVVEIITGRPTSPNVKLEQLQTKANELIQSNPKQFLAIVSDEYLNVKTLIKKAVERNIISKKNDLYYLSKDGSPLCELGEESTFNIAAKYLSSPKHQELRFMIESQVK